MWSSEYEREAYWLLSEKNKSILSLTFQLIWFSGAYPQCSNIIIHGRKWYLCTSHLPKFLSHLILILFRFLKTKHYNGNSLRLDNEAIVWATINSRETSSQEIHHRPALSRAAMKVFKKIVGCHDVFIPIKIRRVQAMVFPVKVLESEHWTLKKKIKKKVLMFLNFRVREDLKIPQRKQMNRPSNKSTQSFHSHMK